MVNLARLEEVSGKVFDYVVIGGGTAGLTVAARLSEDPTKSVLVLEAGGAHFDDVAFCKSRRDRRRSDSRDWFQRFPRLTGNSSAIRNLTGDSSQSVVCPYRGF